MNNIDKTLCDQYLAEKWDTIVWSYSRIETMYKCPYTFYDNYVVGNRSTNYLAYRGTMLHDIIDSFYTKGGIALGLDLDTVRDTMIKKFDYYMQKWEEPKTFKDIEGEEKIRNSIRQFVPREDIIQTERTVLFELGGYNFQAKLDYETEDVHGDFKSTWNKQYFNQQLLYAFARQRDAGRPMLNKFEVSQYNIGFKVKEIKFSDLDLRDMRNYYTDGIRMIKTALETAEFPYNTKSKWFCQNLCKKCDL